LLVSFSDANDRFPERQERMDKERRRFERYDEFYAQQQSFLAIDLNTEPTAFEDKQESAFLTKFSEIVRIFITETTSLTSLEAR